MDIFGSAWSKPVDDDVVLPACLPLGRGKLYILCCAIRHWSIDWLFEQGCSRRTIFFFFKKSRTLARPLDKINKPKISISRDRTSRIIAVAASCVRVFHLLLFSAYHMLSFIEPLIKSDTNYNLFNVSKLLYDVEKNWINASLNSSDAGQQVRAIAYWKKKIFFEV